MRAAAPIAEHEAARRRGVKGGAAPFTKPLTPWRLAASLQPRAAAHGERMSAAPEAPRTALPSLCSADVEDVTMTQRENLAEKIREEARDQLERSDAFPDSSDLDIYRRTTFADPLVGIQDAIKSNTPPSE